ncbi:transcription factor IIF subunit TFG1 [Aspergillus mulundensis]|uniref:Transcription initiation factor IIF subunit alpha n=1 Tax=Aspergillus mulundensis TaxID=1810919 RepID=A0A3D8SCA9_9EURO|nr:putative Transcription initiation factor IIF subunit alpha [Aspergillus mulundensis]RDW83982.1 putative Transcription initiation factor IIF subunit alpha [Aspergillus mulundensis]
MTSTPKNKPTPQMPTASSGVPPMRIRRARAADPLVRPKRRTAAKGPAEALRSFPARAAPSNAQIDKLNIPTAKSEFADNGFSGPLLSEAYVDYPLVTTKRAIKESLKHHIARFASKKAVDPRDESQFTRPVRLQRRDPRTRLHELNMDKGQASQRLSSETSNQVDDVEREEMEARKVAREKERADNLAQIAPSVGSAPKRTNVPKQKTQQVSKTDMTPEEIARTRIKYEEALPWHLEDFDNKNIWVGNYEAALSETHAVFIFGSTGKMTMIPVEKWYRFNAKNQFKTLTIEEAEKFMAKKIKDPRWFMEKQQEQAQRQELEKFARQRKVYAGKQGTPAAEGLEADDMDFEEDRFADDEEHDDLFGENEDAKAAEKRIKQDQLKANIFDLKNEKEYEEEELREKREKEARRVLGKKVRKALQKREKNYDYSSGSDANPYTDESSDETDDEKPKEDERKTEEEKSKKDSATSSKGNTTPSGRPKYTDPSKKLAVGVSRKRIGSPNVSDASGTDTSRKKGKSKHSPSQSSLQPGSRPMSPASFSAPVRNPAGPGGLPTNVAQINKKRVRNTLPGAGSASDIDGGAGSAGEMSETGKPKKLKLNPPSMNLQGITPQRSRAGFNATGQPRVSTPGPTAQGFPSPGEIHAAIPASGILSTDLLKIFRPRIGDSRENHRKFIAIVKDVGVYGKEDRLLRPGPWRET